MRNANFEATHPFLAAFFAFGERLNNDGNRLSGGEQQMLIIGRALMTNPDLRT